MKICSNCSFTHDDDNLTTCPMCEKELKWIDKEVYENNQKFLNEFYKQQKAKEESKSVDITMQQDKSNKKMMTKVAKKHLVIMFVSLVIGIALFISYWLAYTDIFIKTTMTFRVHGCFIVEII